MNAIKEAQLIKACESGDTNLVKQLLSEEIDINCVQNDGDNPSSNYQVTPLIIACRARHLEIVKLLLNDNRINVNQKVKCGDNNPKHTALHEACCNGTVTIARLLITDYRTDKSDINNLIQIVFGQVNSGLIEREPQQESLQILLMLFADPAAKNLDFLTVFAFDTNRLISLIALTHPSNWSPQFNMPLAGPKKEAHSALIAYALFLSRKLDATPDSVASAILDQTSNRSDETDKLFKERFKLHAGLQSVCVEETLNKMLGAIYNQEIILTRLRSFRQRINASIFLNGFFTHPKVVSLKIGGLTEAFQRLPEELQCIIASFVFNVPEEHMYLVSEDILKRDNEELMRNSIM